MPDGTARLVVAVLLEGGKPKESLRRALVVKHKPRMVVALVWISILATCSSGPNTKELVAGSEKEADEDDLAEG